TSESPAPTTRNPRSFTTPCWECSGLHGSWISAGPSDTAAGVSPRFGSRTVRAWDPTEKTTSPLRPPTKMPCGLSIGRRWNVAPSRCTSHACGPNITPVTSVRSCATLTATTSKRSGGARSVAGMSNTDAAAQELLRDAFTRLIEHVDELTDGLTDELSSY